MPIDSTSTIQFVQELLRNAETPRDALPYTQEFDDLKRLYQEEIGQPINNHAFWKLISRVGKRGGLKEPGGKKKLRNKRHTTPKWQQLEILRLFPEGIGGRDDLPYTNHFDELYRRYSSLTGAKVSRNEFWRAVSGVAKKSRKPKPIFETAPLTGLPSDTIEFLERNNPWWQGKPQKELPSILRWAYKDIDDRINSGIAPIIALEGPRQIGKTTIQQQYIDHLLRLGRIHPSRILRVQFDEVPSLGVLENPVEKIIKWYERNILKKTLNETAASKEHAYLLFDEVQNLKHWPEQLKTIVDHSDVKIFITGSSALRIQRGKDSLVGRLHTIELGPLRLNEISKFRELEYFEPYSHPSQIKEWSKISFWNGLVDHGKKHVRSINEAFKYFSLYGGYPICHKKGLDVESLATQIVNDVVERTIGHEHAPGVSEEITKALFKLICRYTGERVKRTLFVQQVAPIVGGTVSDREIQSAIDYLEKTLLVCLLRPIELLRKKTDVCSTYCVCDHFIRFAVIHESIPLIPQELKNKSQSIATQAGHIIEGIMGTYFSKLPGISVATFPGNQNEKEVDIVLTIGCQRIPIEVKYQSKISGSDLRGIKDFCNKSHYAAPFGIIITRETEGLISENIVAIPAKTILAISVTEVGMSLDIFVQEMN